MIVEGPVSGGAAKSRIDGPATVAGDTLRAVFQLQMRLAAERDAVKLPTLVVAEAERLLGVDRGTLFLYDGNAFGLRTAHADGLAGGGLVMRTAHGGHRRRHPAASGNQNRRCLRTRVLQRYHPYRVGSRFSA